MCEHLTPLHQEYNVWERVPIVDLQSEGGGAHEVREWSVSAVTKARK